MTGAAPVPVPPPMPAVTNTMSAPCRASATRDASSSAAARPISGFAPAPRPRVKFLPRWTFTPAMLASSTWQSVLETMKSTPSTPASIIVLTALPPPPPTPITLIAGRPGPVPSSSNSSIWGSSTYRSHGRSPKSNFLVFLRLHLRCDHVELLDVRGLREQLAGLGHEGRREPPAEVGLAAGLGVESVEDGERLRNEANGEPEGGLALLLNDRQAALEQLGQLRFLAGLGV